VSWLPWKRRSGDGRHRTKKDGATVNMNDSQDLAMLAFEANNAKARADAALEDAHRRAPEVSRMSLFFERRLERNHWAEMMEQSFQRKHNG